MRRRRSVAAAALVALMFGVACVAMTVLLVGRLLAGRPATTPLEVFQPDLTFLVPGTPLPLPWGEPLPVTIELVRAVAAVLLGLFGGAALLWLAAGTGLLRMRRWGRALALVLFIGTTALGLWNVFLGLLLVVLEGRAALLAMAGPLVVMLLFLVALPGISAVLLLLPGVWRAFLEADDGPVRPALITGLVIHYLLATVLLAGAAVAPAALGEPRLLLGPWLVGGLAARLMTGVAALVHGVAAWLCWQRRPRAYALSFWLNGGLAVLAASSAAVAPPVALEWLGAGLLSASTVRGLLIVAAGVGASVVAMVVVGRRSLTPAARAPR